MSSLKRKPSTLTNGDAKKSKQDGNILSFFKGPKESVSSTAQAGKAVSEAGMMLPPSAAAPINFDKPKWITTLTAEQKELLKLELDTMDDSWLAVLKDEIKTPEFLALKKFLAREQENGTRVFPPKEDIYSWSRHTPFNSVKVVILGQDPYHNVNQAHGLAFSVRPPTPAPPSLKNMYIALKNDYPGFVAPAKKGGLLTPWAEKGVLLLNTCLTVRAHQANSHANHGWERFTQKVIDVVAQKRTRGVVFMAWGTPAGKRVVKIDTKRHLVLKAVHPSPLSAARGFFECGHFKQANGWLVTRYGEGSEIDWNLAPVAATNGEQAKDSETAKKVPVESIKPATVEEE